MTEIKKILYAEDELDIQFVFQIAMEQFTNFDLKICSSGIEILKEVNDYNPDLIILDVMMPEMDGPLTFKQLKLNEQSKDIPVIFMTAKAQVTEVQKYLDQGAIGVITKPFDPVSICNEINEIWNMYQGNISKSKV